MHPGRARPQSALPLHAAEIASGRERTAAPRRAKHPAPAGSSGRGSASWWRFPAGWIRWCCCTCCMSWRPSIGWRLTAAHLNHQLRGRSSDADERLVRRTAERLKLPVVVEAGGCARVGPRAEAFPGNGRAKAASRFPGAHRAGGGTSPLSRWRITRMTSLSCSSCGCCAAAAAKGSPG